LPSGASFAKDIAVFEIALGAFEHGCTAENKRRPRWPRRWSRWLPRQRPQPNLRRWKKISTRLGQLISRLQRELADERHAYDAINAHYYYTLMIGAAENL
jgi:hypothetical protein